MLSDRAGLKCGLAISIALGCELVLTTAAPAAVTTIVNNGPSSNRVDIVFLGDGYTQSDLNAGFYNTHVQNYINYMFGAPSSLTDPYPRYSKFFNAHRIDLVSNQSGADIPAQSISVDTALDASYMSINGDDRLLTISESKANAVRTAQLAGTGITADMQLVSVNHWKYGGSGGSWAVFAGANPAAQEIAVHELGHEFANLADEYVSFPGQAYTAPEPTEANVTKNPTGQKWSQWLGFQDPRDPALNIGVVQGGKYYDTGIYRPSANSKMRTLSVPFNAVSREAIILKIYSLVDPLDSWRSNSGTLTQDGLWVDSIDPSVIGVDWYVDNQLVAADYGESFDLADFGFSSGAHSVRAHAYDRIITHAFDGGMLDLVRTHLDQLQEDITWSLALAIPLPGDYNHDGHVDMVDYGVWAAVFGTNTTPADGNGDGVIDAADYAVWRDHFGATSSGAGGVNLAPEPATGAIAVGILAGLVVIRPFGWYRRRQGRRGWSG